MSKESNSSTSGIGFCGLLTIAFIVLKLTGFINWSWLWVLSPIWLPLALVLLALLVVWVFYTVKLQIWKLWNKKVKGRR